MKEKKYYIQENGVVSPLYSLEELKSKNILPNSLGCEEYGTWKEAQDMPALKQVLNFKKGPNTRSYIYPILIVDLLSFSFVLLLFLTCKKYLASILAMLANTLGILIFTIVFLVLLFGLFKLIRWNYKAFKNNV